MKILSINILKNIKIKKDKGPNYQNIEKDNGTHYRNN